ncbi:WD and tetratricopeptide repeats protein 1-like [Ischnura elegans]|uniref:WD and tetratricopeptide repeats protein 1-like n=1 Tax=Ischnura elegans TaxID=197161 RepID=UPI001ED8AE37|nr:WD and tetratricopeptide repeats protein 1-like [Ischnura elegans]XP_046399121.1 WD and tetratricopeptide repeats protein 1-like [Ischnura elegans]XP_046399122.1 WD and tetratricopeptide repeats protein 1-like [Ischnura elegans]
MMMKTSTTGHNVLPLLRTREIKENVSYSFKQSMHVTEDFINRLGLEKELEGHSGCVNCLEWSESGTVLASASDDVLVILWDPFRYKKIHTISTGHLGNIFSVKFLPSNENTLVTGAGDHRIRVHDVTAGEATQCLTCHTSRVKRLATAPNLPYMFWSASEDGTVRQFDLRSPLSCSTPDVANVLINLLDHLGHYAEAKCLAVNPLRPELIAVGANDPYVRLYDRRMIKLTSVQFPPSSTPPSSPAEAENENANTPMVDREGADNLSLGCVQYFVAGHLPKKLQDYRKRCRNLAATYLTFGADGNELLVNLGGEQIYLFDINNKRKPKTYDCHVAGSSHDEKSSQKLVHFEANGCSYGLKLGSGKDTGIFNGGTTKGVPNGTNGVTFPSSKASLKSSSLKTTQSSGNSFALKKPPLPIRAETLKLKANDAFEKQQYTVAINLYNQAISVCPMSAILHGNRAAAYMKRGWDGDIYSALRDCHLALQIDPNHLKAHFRLARCLHELQWTKEAWECLSAFCDRFPEHAHSHACRALYREIVSLAPPASPTPSDSGLSSNASSEVKKSKNTRSKYLKKAPPPESDDAAEDDEDVEDDSGTGSGPGDVEEPSRINIHRSLFSQRAKNTSEKEKVWRKLAYDYEVRFCGHCNTTTDIKEANFFGRQGQYIVAGSDDGSFFIWDRKTTNIAKVLRGDESIVNCLLPHPSQCLLATSGIDPVVRLWSPRPEDGTKNDREVMDLDRAASANQMRMNADPFEVMLLNMGYRISPLSGNSGEGPDGDAEGAASGADAGAINCRPS